MLFNSIAFLIFLPAVVILYYLLPHKYRWLLLLVASYFFYGWWKIEYLALILMSTLVDFFVAQAIHRSEKIHSRKILLACSLATNLGLLALFKYLILFLPAKDPMLLNIYSVDHPILAVIIYGVYFSIPVGISFYTFQTLSYTLDVYFRRTKPEQHMGYFALFVSFFPQLVAGPIERSSHLIPQFKEKHTALYSNFSKAFRLMLYGFFIKICIADNLAPMVDEVFANPGSFGTFSRWFGTFGFGFQIYADFAGYSLIAQGAALCLGIDLMDNFRTPYLSTSISEFWKRWHISLSTWFRDYLYLPLGGNRVSKTRWVFNILLVFTISGFWHGANWTFLIWGSIHGILYLFERFVWGKPKENSSVIVRLSHGLRTFILVNFAWLFFRIDSLDKVGNHLSSLVLAGGEETLSFKPEFIFMFILFLLSDRLLYNKRVDGAIDKFPLIVRWSIYFVLLLSITLWGGVTNHPFIYFQF